jgi:hypothetical protein
MEALASFLKGWDIKMFLVALILAATVSTAQAQFKPDCYINMFCKVRDTCWSVTDTIYYRLDSFPSDPTMGMPPSVGQVRHMIDSAVTRALFVRDSAVVAHLCDDTMRVHHDRSSYEATISDAKAKP